jgi:hypothetical protein
MKVPRAAFGPAAAARAHSIPSLRGKQERGFRPTASAMSPTFLSPLPATMAISSTRTADSMS